MTLKEFLLLIEDCDPEAEIYLGHTSYLIDNFNLNKVFILENKKMIYLKSNKFENEPEISEFDKDKF